MIPNICEYDQTKELLGHLVLIIQNKAYKVDHWERPQERKIGFIVLSGSREYPDEILAINLVDIGKETPEIRAFWNNRKENLLLLNLLIHDGCEDNYGT